MSRNSKTHVKLFLIGFFFSKFRHAELKVKESKIFDLFEYNSRIRCSSRNWDKNPSNINKSILLKNYITGKHKKQLQTVAQQYVSYLTESNTHNADQNDEYH